MESIRLEKIVFQYGKKEILHNLSFLAKEGECIALVGKNGCGKSTLLELLAGIKKTTGGKIYYYGEELCKKNIQNLVGYVPQENILIEECSVADNLRLWYKEQDDFRNDLEQGFLVEFGIKEMLTKKCCKLSGGMKKKVSIACALANHPKILILDEPCAALDLESKRQLRQYLLWYAKKGNTVLMATHEETDFSICNQVISLEERKEPE